MNHKKELLRSLWVGRYVGASELELEVGPWLATPKSRNLTTLNQPRV